MAKNVRSKTQRRADMIVIERLYIRGLSQDRIAEEISGVRGYTLSRRQVRYDLDEILIEWGEAMKVERRSHIVAQLQKLDRMEAECWEEWDRSKLNTEKLQSKRSESGDETRNEVMKTTEGRTGNTKYMEQLLGIIDRRIKLLALVPTQPYPFQDQVPGVTSFADLVASAVEYVGTDLTKPREIEVLPPRPPKDDNGKNGSGNGQQ